MNSPSKFDPRGSVPEGKKWKKRKALPELLDKYKVAASGCWEWTGTVNKQGYGVVGLFVEGIIYLTERPTTPRKESCST